MARFSVPTHRLLHYGRVHRGDLHDGRSCQLAKMRGTPSDPPLAGAEEVFRTVIPGLGAVGGDP